MKKLHLYLSDDYLGELIVDQVRGHETYAFRYDEAYLRADRPLLDPSIRNVAGPQYPLSNGIFGLLADVAPDRWGRKLIRRREKRSLFESDFVLGVCDLTRQGAIRIKEEKAGPFVASDLGDAAPPWTTLRRLEESARHLDADDRGDEEAWLRDLFRPGTSLGGARPKANVTAPDGSLWIAKFPSSKDEWDVGEREYETSVLARKVGLNVPETKASKFSKAGTTFFSKRFDRDGERRLHYASAMTMLGAADGEDGHSYLEIAEFIAANGCEATEDLRELWRRMVFSDLIHNTDDHLRNHGFLLTPQGWRLAPMFDVNPDPNAGEHALDMGDIIGDAGYYRLTRSEAEQEYARMKALVEGAEFWYNQRHGKVV